MYGNDLSWTYRLPLQIEIKIENIDRIGEYEHKVHHIHRKFYFMSFSTQQTIINILAWKWFCCGEKQNEKRLIRWKEKDGPSKKLYVYACASVKMKRKWTGSMIWAEQLWQLTKFMNIISFNEWTAAAAAAAVRMWPAHFNTWATLSWI